MRSFLDAGLIVGVYSDGRPLDNSVRPATGYSISRDGGLTWRRGLAENLTRLTGGTMVGTGDPVAAIDLAGNIYLSNLDVEGMSFFSVSRMTNGATTFASPVQLGKVSGSTVDKEWIAVNTYPNSPTANRIVLTWTKGDASGSNIQGLQSTYSDDGAATWSNPVAIFKSAAQNTQPLFFPNGSLAVLFVDAGFRIHSSYSPDGGVTYGTNRPVAQISIYVEPRARNAPFFFSAASDRQAGILYVTYQATYRQGTNSRPAIMFTRSIDRGQTWSTPTPVNDTPNKRSVFTPAIAASPDGQHVIIEFYDKRNDTGSGYLVDLYMAESFDGGDTWEPNIRISDFTSDMRKAPLSQAGPSPGYFLGDYIGIVPALGLGENAPAVACWIDTRSGSSDPYSARIQRARGATFETWRKLRWGTNHLANAAISGPAADPDSDGIPNFSEYALGLEPNRANAGTLQVTPLSGRGFFVTYTHPTVLSDVEFSWEESTDLVRWKGSQPAISTDPNTPSSFWKSTNAFFNNSDETRFVRLVVHPKAP